METKGRGIRNRGSGLALLVIAIVIFVVYAYFLLATQWSVIVLQFTVLGAVGTLVTVLAWIGYTIATARRTDNDNNDIKQS